MIKTLSTKIVYQNKWMTVCEDEVEFPDGKSGIYGVVDKPHFALIVPYENRGFYLVNQYRYPVKKSYWEFPQGSHEEKKDVSPLELAQDELKEETGLVAGKMMKIGFHFKAYGYSNQGFHIFLATDLQQGHRKLDSTEQDLETAFFTIDKFEKMVNEGSIVDSATIGAYGLLRSLNIF